MRVLLIIILSLSLSLSLPVLADVRLWVSDTTTQGDIGGRTGADGVCDSDTNKPAVASSTTRAFISVDTDDEIRDMPSLYNIPSNEVIFRQDGTTQIAPNFAALLNADSASLISSVSTAGFSVFTGSSFDGELDSLGACNGWTASGTVNLANIGDSLSLDGAFLFNSASVCRTNFRLYCITYTAPVASRASTGLTEW